MSGEILADGDSPMIMTVDQYNERVARTWNLAIAAEQERIINLLDSLIEITSPDQTHTISINDALCNAIALIKGEK